MTFVPQIIFKLLCKIYGPRNIAHWPTVHTRMKSIFVSDWSIIQHLTFIHPILFEDIRQKSLDHEIQVIDQHMFYEINLCTILIHYPTYNISTSNSLQDIKLNRWTWKNRSLAYIYFMRSISVSYGCIIPKYNVYPSNHFEDMKPTLWAIQYRSVIFIHFMSKCLCHTALVSQVWPAHIKWPSRYKIKSLNHEM